MLATTTATIGCAFCGSRSLTHHDRGEFDTLVECDDCGTTEWWHGDTFQANRPNPLIPRAVCPACKDGGTIDLPKHDDRDTYPCPVCHPWDWPAFPGLAAHSGGKRYYIIDPAERGEPAHWNGYRNNLRPVEMCEAGEAPF